MLEPLYLRTFAKLKVGSATKACSLASKPKQVCLTESGDTPGFLNLDFGGEASIIYLGTPRRYIVQAKA
jgi:hypothetical protein